MNVHNLSSLALFQFIFIYFASSQLMDLRLCHLHHHEREINDCKLQGCFLYSETGRSAHLCFRVGSCALVTTRIGTYRHVHARACKNDMDQLDFRCSTHFQKLKPKQKNITTNLPWFLSLREKQNKTNKSVLSKIKN